MSHRSIVQSFKHLHIENVGLDPKAGYQCPLTLGIELMSWLAHLFTRLHMNLPRDKVSRSEPLF